MDTNLKMNSLINTNFYHFVNEEVLPHLSLQQGKFWDDFHTLINDFSPLNRELLETRQLMQNQINEWHMSHDGEMDKAAYRSFLTEIGYIVPEGDDFKISTDNVDEEIATMAGPQLVVPSSNARFALNAANARWGSLYDVLYGTNVISQEGELALTKGHNLARGEQVVISAKNFLDEHFSLVGKSHQAVTNYCVEDNKLIATFADASQAELSTPSQFFAFAGDKQAPESLVLKNNGLHIEIVINSKGFNGAKDLANVDDIIIESALTTIVDCEDSVATIDADEKLEVYQNWLGLMLGNLETEIEKNGETFTRKLNQDKTFRGVDGKNYHLHGRSLMLIRNVGHLMDSDLMKDNAGNFVPEGIIDTVVTTAIGLIDLKDNKKGRLRNSRTNSIYIVKPKMHGPDEVTFTCDLFARVEDMLELPRNTIKLGIMDEERRTTVNLKECIRRAKERVAFINTGFLDRTGDEIHTSMRAGAFLPKDEIKTQPWIQAYENRSVDIGLECGLSGKAQIGKGMWAMPNEMAKMMKDKITHPRSGANTAWVPSPTAAVLHALHYHEVDVFAVQTKLLERQKSSLADVLTIPLMSSVSGEKAKQLSTNDIEKELENNIQGILGYVVRWIEMGIGCSTVPDINNIGLMEDRATLRISSQHIANWLFHNICTDQQVLEIMERMAKVVDEQNQNNRGYKPMTENMQKSMAFQAAKELIFNGGEQPNGYTEPVLHKYRLLAKGNH
ncbi:malate synthase G [Pseudocolwellia sp. HL-MZ19]|uniref:malate synthase G n=1 Tax=Pseudocolwellia sp. HL-MZ19 TaxID=3400846 RepID=UPI003CF2CD52